MNSDAFGSDFLKLGLTTSVLVPAKLDAEEPSIYSGRRQMTAKNPLDDERTNALGLFNTARSYWRSAEHLSVARIEVTHPQAPITFLLCHALELYLKAFLRGKLIV
jgi:hypothetical protein